MLCATMQDGLALASKCILPFARSSMASATSGVRLPAIQITLSIIQNDFTLPLQLAEWIHLACSRRDSDPKIVKMAFLEASLIGLHMTAAYLKDCSTNKSC